jgi:hypothetical protein
MVDQKLRPVKDQVHDLRAKHDQLNVIQAEHSSLHNTHREETTRALGQM